MVCEAGLLQGAHELLKPRLERLRRGLGLMRKVLDEAAGKAARQRGCDLQGCPCGSNVSRDTSRSVSASA